MSIGLAVVGFGTPAAGADDAVEADTQVTIDETTPSTFADFGASVPADQVAEVVAESDNDPGAAIALALAAGAVVLAIAIFAWWISAYMDGMRGLECIIGGC